MPTPEQILTGLTEIANRWQGLAIAWHIYLAVLVVALMRGVRPTRRLAGVLLALPLFSVAALAGLSRNPFNAVWFAVVGLIGLVLAARAREGVVRIAPPWRLLVGALLLGFGWIYPHFLATDSWLAYLHSAPTGLVPCPTLAAVIGLALILDGLGPRGWPLLLGATGIFYGLFGALRLGVTIDAVLLIGATALLVSGLRTRRAAADARLLVARQQPADPVEHQRMDVEERVDSRGQDGG